MHGPSLATTGLLALALLGQPGCDQVRTNIERSLNPPDTRVPLTITNDVGSLLCEVYLVSERTWDTQVTSAPEANRWGRNVLGACGAIAAGESYELLRVAELSALRVRDCSGQFERVYDRIAPDEVRIRIRAEPGDWRPGGDHGRSEARCLPRRDSP